MWKWQTNDQSSRAYASEVASVGRSQKNSVESPNKRINDMMHQRHELGDEAAQIESCQQTTVDVAHSGQDQTPDEK